MSGYMGSSNMQCCYNSVRFAQNAHCVTGGNSGLDQGTSILLLSVATCSSSLRCESLALERGTGC